MAKIKAVFFDLDDTLFDCSGQLAKTARRRAAQFIARTSKKYDVSSILKMMEQYYERGLSTSEVVKRICAKVCGSKHLTCTDGALSAYNSGKVGNIRLFPDALPLLKELKKRGISSVLITSGVLSRQMEKIRKLKLEPWMDLIFVHDIETGGEYKTEYFREAMRKLSVKPSEVLNVGDRLRQEIRSGNQLGLISVRILKGNYKNQKPRDHFEEPDFEINNLSEILDIISQIQFGRPTHPNIVAIGGGTGLPMVLSALKHYSRNITGIVTVTDSGRSSGVLRKELNILPPGDLRNCLIALSDSEELLLNLFQYRFEKGGLEGHSLGNLFLAALAKITGSFEQAVKEASRILAIRGRVIPSTLQDTHVCCELEDGTILEEEFNVRKPGKPPIKRVFLRDEAEPSLDALEAIKEARLIVIGPGSLYTSIVPNLLVKGIPEAIRNSRAVKVYIANMMTQPGQTDGMSLSQHVMEVEKYLGGGVLHYVVYNNTVLPPKIRRQYQKEGADTVTPDLDKLPATVKPVGRDLYERGSKQVLWHKQFLLRHDPDKLRRVLMEIVEKG